MKEAMLLRRALAAIDELEAKLAAAKTGPSGDVAIVGMSCRFPGADGPDTLWRLLESGTDAIRTFPRERLADVGENPARTDLPAGGFIDGIDLFDPGFFGISPREAVSLDPQQRLLLEGVWRALEDAAIVPASLHGSRTGVFVGITTSDYAQLTRGSASDVYVATGGALNAAAGRISFTLGLQGPCMAIDTACSSSLVALHNAALSLRAGESDVAIAAGVNALLSTHAFELFARWGMLAPDGRCKTFDASADGFSRGEGCGVLVLRRLTDAQRDGDRILGIIRGSAVNQDGRSSGLSVPNGLAQQQILRAALERAGCAPADIDYVEAHGTGTVLGDPIEVEAIGAVLGTGRPQDQPLRIGSIKTNVGHLESASGIAGVCKTLLALQHEAIPQHLHFREPNPRIAWADLPIEVPTRISPWPRGERPRRAGVSSFGFTGTNAHVILEEAPLPQVAPECAGPVVIPVSARSADALVETAASIADALDRESAGLGDVAHTAGAGRTHFAVRTAVVARDAADAAARLRGLSADHAAADPSSAEPPRIAFLFTGQGAHAAGLGRALYDRVPAFRQAIDRCAAVAEAHGISELRERLLDASASGDAAERGTAFAQPALFMLGYALAELWRSWGVIPTAVAGHSVGEIAAACVAGAVDVEDAMRFAIERGAAMARLPGGGAMAAVFASESDVRSAIAPRLGQLDIAAVNGPSTTVISGEAAAVGEICEAFRSRGIESRRLDVSHAFHSPLIEPSLEPVRTAAERASWTAPRITLVSDVDGTPFAPGVAPDADYWRRHARQPVRFADVVATLRSLGCDTFVEIGPGTTLVNLARRLTDAHAGDGAAGIAAALPSRAPITTVPSIGSASPDRLMEELLVSLARLYERGVPIDWTAVGKGSGGRRVAIPGCAFERRRYWIERPATAAASVNAQPLLASSAEHPLLGARLDLAGDGDLVWFSFMDLETFPWLADHRVQNVVIVPATAYLEMAFAAAREWLGDAPVRLFDVVNEKPLVLRDDARFQLQTRLIREARDAARYEVHARPVGDGVTQPWTRLVSGRLVRLEAEVAEPFDVAAARARCVDALDGTAFYAALDARGNQWGPAFRGMDRVWRGEGEAVARVKAPVVVSAELDRFRFHPALADAAGHVLVATNALERSASATGGALVGGGAREVRWYAPPSGELWTHAVVTGHSPGDNVVTGDVRVYDDDGRLVSEIVGARLWYLPDTHASPADELFYRIRWETPGDGDAAVATDLQRWCILSDDDGLASAVGASLEARGRSVERLPWPGDATTLASRLAAQGPSGIVFADAEGGAGALERLRALVGASVAAGVRGRLFLVTRGARPTRPTEQVDAAGAALWGFGRALGAEHRELWGGLIDVDPHVAVNAQGETLAEVLLAPPAGRLVALRDGVTRVPRLERFTPEPAPVSPVDGTWLITGGLGGIGLQVARRLAGRGCRSLVLVGRSTPPHADTAAQGNAAHARDGEATPGRWADALRIIDELRRSGVAVHVAACDVGDVSAVRALRADLERAAIPLPRGIVHAAGVLHYGPVGALDAQTVDAIVNPKVRGALALCDVFADTRPAFVFFSSNSALLPSPLMAAYAGANAFLDGFAGQLRADGLDARSIAWGTWGEVGMATRFESEQGRGNVLTALRTLTTEEALGAFDTLMSTDSTYAAVMRMDWDEWRRLYPEFTRDPFFAGILGGEAVDGGEAEDGDDVVAAVRVASSAEARGEALMRYACTRIGGVLGIEPDRIDARLGVNHLGFDSLMALETKNRIEAELGVIVPMVALLDGPSVEQLADRLAEALANGTAAPPLASASAGIVEGEL